MAYYTRLVDAEPSAWKDKVRRKTLLMRGARQVGKYVILILGICLLVSCNNSKKEQNKRLITDYEVLKPVIKAEPATSKQACAQNNVTTLAINEATDFRLPFLFEKDEEPNEEYWIFRKKVDSLGINVRWVAYFEPKEDDIEYQEFIKWSRMYLLKYDYDHKLRVDTSIIESWNDIMLCNAKCVDEIINDELSYLNEGYSGIVFDRVVALNRNKTELFSNYTITIETYGKDFGRGEFDQYTAIFNNTTGERFTWDCIIDVDGLLSKIEKRYLGGFIEDSETWINTDSLVIQMKKQKPRTEPYLRMENNILYLCLFYQHKEVYPGREIPFEYEVSFPIDSIIQFLSERGKGFTNPRQSK